MTTLLHHQPDGFDAQALDVRRLAGFGAEHG
jgi:hypothetical protein